MARRGEIEVTGNTKGAQNALGSLDGSFLEFKAKLDLVSQAASAVSSVFSGMIDTLKEGGDFWSQMGAAGETAAAKLEIMRTATDDLIKSSELLRSSNVLTTNNIQLTTEQMEALGKAAVYQARATGQSTESLMRMFTDAISSGRVSALNKFGFQLETTGELAEKQARVIDALTTKYKDMEVQAGDTAEAFAKTNNALKAEELLATKNVDMWGQVIAKAKYFWSSSAFAGNDNMIANFKNFKEMQELSNKLSERARQLIQERVDLSADLRWGEEMRGQGLDKQIENTDTELAKQREIVKTLTDQTIPLRASIIAKTKAGQKTDKEKKDLEAVNELLKSQQGILDGIIARRKNLNDQLAKAGEYIKAQFFGALQRGAELVKQYDEREKRRKAANKRAGEQEAAERQRYRVQAKNYADLMKRAGELVTLEDFKKYNELLHMATLTRAQRARYQAEIKNIDEVERRKLAARESEKKNEADAAALALKNYTKAATALDMDRKSLELNRQLLAVTDGKNTREKLLQENKRTTIQIQREELRLQTLLREKKYEEALAVKTQINALKDEIYTRQQKITALDKEKAKVEELKKEYKKFTDNKAFKVFSSAVVSGSQAMTKAIFMTDKELKAAGKSRSQILAQGAAEFLRTTGQQLIGDGVKNLLIGTGQSIWGIPTGPGLMGLGATEIGAGSAMGATGYFGLSGIDTGSETAKGASAQATATPTAAATQAQTINENYYISNSAIAGTRDQLISSLDSARMSKRERGA